MELYLMRHGAATTAEQDPERPLTPTGRAVIERVAWRAAAARFRPDAIYHSDIRRAEQTAEILARHLGVPDHVQPRQGLQPEDAVEPVAEWLLEQASGDSVLALVGHLPFLDRLVACLVLSDPQAHVLDFQPGALVKLTPRADRRRFVICWMLAPGVV